MGRAKISRIRAGIGKMRGRKTRRATSALLVFSTQCPGIKAAENIPGVEAITVEELNAEFLAPGTHAGRLTLYTDEAIKKMSSEKLFLNGRPKPVKEEKLSRVKARSVKKDMKKDVKKDVKAAKKTEKVKSTKSTEEAEQ